MSENLMGRVQRIYYVVLDPFLFKEKTVIDIEPIQKKTNRYRELLQNGILISQFAGTYDIRKAKWRLDFILTRQVTGAEVKALLSSYVAQEYDGTELEFFKSRSNPDSIGCVMFMRGDL